MRRFGGMPRLRVQRRRQVEHAEQVALFEWMALAATRWPELRLAYAIPNGARRSARDGAKLKREGLKAGMPDVVLPVPRGGFAALYVELKRPDDGGRLSPAQRLIHPLLRAAGNRVEVCRGWDAARLVIEDYLRLPVPEWLAA